MAQFSVEIADTDVDRVINALAFNYRRQTTIKNPDFDPTQPESEENPKNIPNPETLSQFANRMVRKFLEDNVSTYEIRVARQQAEEQANTDVSIIDPAL
mgnify:CR=1 FL=1